MKGGDELPHGEIPTTDIWKGAYFLSCGCDLATIKYDKASQVGEFFFTGPDIEQLEKAYRSGKALVNPVQFREALNNLRDMLFKEKREDGERDERQRHRKKQSSFSQPTIESRRRF